MFFSSQKDDSIKIFSFSADAKWGLLLSFLFGFTVRLVPEILSYPYPIGFDTVYYAATIKTGVIWYSFPGLFWPWLIFGFLIPIYVFTHVDLFVLLKLTAPVIYAFNVGGIYFFARKILNWKAQKAMLASLFFMFQLASLRISWDLHNNALGLAFLLFLLPLIRDVSTSRRLVCFSLLSVLVVLSHEIASVVMFVAFFGVMLRDQTVRSFRLSMALLPASFLFFMRIFLNMFPIDFPLWFPVSHNVINTVQRPVHPGGLFFLVDYMNTYSSYFGVTLHVVSLFAVLYMSCLPIIFLGFFRDLILDAWVLFLLFGSINVLITPFCALDFWNRWMFLLVYPFTFYATNGAWKVLKLKANAGQIFKWMKASRKTVFGILVLTILLGTLFMVIPVDMAVYANSNLNPYFPSTMLHNTVPLQDVTGVSKSIDWLNGHMSSHSCVIVHHAFLSWMNLYLEKAHIVVYFVNDISKAINISLEHDFHPIYFVWWNEDTGWYGLTVPSDFFSVFRSGRISVFEYSPAGT